MIDLEDMNNLFELISKKLRKDVACFAFGGNAMMHYGYKTATKDIDLLFDDEASREEFIRAITLLGYEKKGLKGIYSQEQQQEKNKPLMFTRGDERFDLFLKEVFQTKINEQIKARIYGKFEYLPGQHTLTVLVLSKEDIILMKSITNREKYFDDILAIVEKEKKVDWKLIVKEAVWQAKHGDKWVILNLEEAMQRLKQHTLIKKDIFELLHSTI